MIFKFTLANVRLIKSNQIKWSMTVSFLWEE